MERYKVGKRKCNGRRVVKDNEIGGIEVKKSRTNETFSREIKNEGTVLKIIMDNGTVGIV